MNAELPPLLDPHAAALPPRPRFNASRVALWLSLAGPAVFLLFMALRPG
jgi:hypothetical protein